MKTKLVKGAYYKLIYIKFDIYNDKNYSFYDLIEFDRNKKDGWTSYNPEIPFVFKNQIKNENNDICYEFYSLEFNKVIVVYKEHFHPLKNRIIKI